MNEAPEVRRLRGWGYPPATTRSMMCDVFDFEQWRLVNVDLDISVEDRAVIAAYLKRRIEELDALGI